MFWKIFHNFHRLKKSAQPNRQFRAALWQKLSVECEGLYPPPVFVWSYVRVAKYGATVLVLVLLSFTVGAGAYAYENPAVNESHWLYPLKRGIEAVEEKTARTAERKAVFHLKQVQRRQAEINTLVEKDRPAPAASADLKKEEEAMWSLTENVISEKEQSIIIEKVLKESLQISEETARNEDKIEQQVEEEQNSKLINPSLSGQGKVREDSGRGRVEEYK